MGAAMKIVTEGPRRAGLWDNRSMKGLGTIVNVLAIIVAGGLGVMLRGKLRTRYQEMLLQVVGIGVIVYGGWSLWDGLMVLQTGQLETTGTILVVFSLLVGTVFGAAFAVERGLIVLGRVFCRFSEREEAKENIRQEREWKKQAIAAKRSGTAVPSPTTDTPLDPKTGAPKKPKRRSIAELPTYDLEETRTGSLYVDGFILATVICAISGMGFSGAMADGLDGSTTTLFIKTAIDAVLVFALATVYGSGVTFAALPVLVVEGLLTIIAILWGDLLTMTLQNQLVLIASVITISAGVNMALGKRLRVANMIPSLLIPPIYGIVMMIVEKSIEK